MLILLDIDGVMVRAASWKQVELLNDGFSAFSQKSVDCLNRIINGTGASIILTTSHKSSFSIPQWHDIFKLRGIQDCTIERLSDNVKNLSRKEEVLNWIQQNDQENFVIIDDDKSLNELDSKFRTRLVQTLSLIGLQDIHAEQAVSILQSHELVIAK